MSVQEKSALTVDMRSITEYAFDSVELVIMAAGYEPRCTHLASMLLGKWECTPEALGSKMLLLEFASQRDLKGRRDADEFYRIIAPRWRMTVDNEDGEQVRQQVSIILREFSRPCRVIVDYTSMSRMLYLLQISLARLGHEVIFCYSLGVYGSAAENYPISTVGSIGSVPGFEGFAYQSRPRIYAFGLGYDGVGTAALADRLEAERIIVFWADPGVTPNAAEISTTRNESLIRRASVSFCRDIRDVRGVVSVLSQIAFETNPTDKLVLVPVGPKPHKLACGIVASRFDHVTLLAPYLGVGGIRENFPEIAAQGEVVCTSVASAE